jgi:hypothetical protein
MSVWQLLRGGDSFLLPPQSSSYHRWPGLRLIIKRGALLILSARRGLAR